MEYPLISVIMPAYNAGQFISEAIRSVQSQTYPHWELIVVNDGSHDDTIGKVQGAAASDERIQLISQKNGRQAKARNTGIKKAAGEWFAFLDADDCWESQKLEKQLSTSFDQIADVFFSEAMLVDDEGNEMGLMQSGKGFFTGELGVTKFLEKNQVPILTSLVKREVFNDHLFDETAALQNAEDYEFWLRLLMNGKILYGSNETLARYTLHASASTAADRSAFLASTTALYRLSQKFPEYRTALLKAMGSKIINWLRHHTGKKTQAMQVSKLYFQAHDASLSRFSEWFGNGERLMKKVERHFEKNYA